MTKAQLKEMITNIDVKYYISRCFFLVLIIVCSLSLIHKYYTCTKPKIEQLMKDPKFSTLGPYDTVEVAVEDTYNRLIDIGNFSFKINSQPCKSYDAGLLLMIIVASSPSRYENREVIRNTWGRNIDSTRIVFLFGETENENLRKRIESESSTYGDVVQGNFVDVYRNLTYKHVMGLKWVAHHCPKAKYILKVDDDVVINSPMMRHFLGKVLSPWGAKDLVICQLLINTQPQRSKNAKWSVSEKEYPGEYYPTYCAGWAILYSQDVIRKLLNTVQTIPYFWIDDVHITGTCAVKLGIPLTSSSMITLPNRKIETLKNMGYKYVGPFVFGPMEQSFNRMQEIWSFITE